MSETKTGVIEPEINLVAGNTNYLLYDREQLEKWTDIAPPHRPVLDHGYIRIRDIMGSDKTVVDAARVSFDQATQWEARGTDLYLAMRDKDKRLLRFLAEHGHWSPFAHPHIMVEFKLPGMVLDQLIKHRIGFTFSDDEGAQEWENSADNQLSMRYKEPTDFYIPAENAWRPAPENKKQGSGEGFIDRPAGYQSTYELTETIRHCVERYQEKVEAGFAPEQARLFIPYYAMYTKRMVTMSLLGVIRLCQLREKPDAQYEIREYAHGLHQLVEPYFPESFAAYGLTTGGTDES